jgi:hypothetical protein
LGSEVRAKGCGHPFTNFGSAALVHKTFRPAAGSLDPPGPASQAIISAEHDKYKQLGLA